nr:hypothetical protein [Actinomycetes bacterium]
MLQQLPLAWLFAKREVQQGLRGFRVFLLCITLGTASIAVIYGAIEGLAATLRDQAQPLLGGDIEARFIHEPAPEAMQAYFDEVAEQRSTTITTRTIARTGDRQLLVELKSVDNAYPLYGELTLEDPPATGALPIPALAAYADSSFAARIGIGIGDQFRIGAAILTLAGTIDNEPDLLSSGGFMVGPRVMVSTETLEQTQLIQPGSLIYYRYRLKITARDAIPAILLSLENDFGTPYWRVRDISDAAPSTRGVLEQLRVFMTITAIVALFIGGIGAGNAMRAWAQQKTAIIALWRSLGASQQLIAKAIFILIAMVATIGIALGLVVGIIASLFVLPQVSAVIPIAPAAGIYGNSLLFAAAAGALITIIFSLPPVFRARRISPAVLLQGGQGTTSALTLREIGWVLLPSLLLIVLAVFSVDSRILAMYLIAGLLVSAFALWLTVRGVILLYRAAPIPATAGWRISRAWLTHPGNHSSEVFISLGLGLAIISFIGLLEFNLNRTITTNLSEDAPTMFFTDIQPAQVDAFIQNIEAVPGYEQLDTAPMLRGRITHLKGIPASEYPRDEGDFNDDRWVLEGDRGITWARSAPRAGSEIIEGTWWPEDYDGDELLVSFDADAAAAFDLAIGDTITFSLLGRPLTARIHNLRQIDWETFAMNFVMVFSPGILERAPQTRLATLYLADTADLDALENSIIAEFPNITPIRTSTILDRARSLIGSFAVAIRVIGLIAITAGMIVLSSVIASENRQRSFDATILKVLGARRSTILGIFMSEFLALGLLSATIASFIA